MKPIHKFNNGRGATLCHLCRTIITVGKPTNDLYCDRCLNERVKIEAEFNAIHKSRKDKEIQVFIINLQHEYDQGMIILI